MRTTTTDVLMTNIISYRTLAQKAVKNENSQTGVAAALERFFHKLEFLLKYGYIPTKEDVKEDHLSPELYGLHAFLTTRTKDSYVLQKDTVTRYRFNHSQEFEGKIEVIEEKCDISRDTPLYANYVGIATWKQSCLQMCEVTDLFSILNSKPIFLQENRFSKGFQIETYEKFAFDTSTEIETQSENLFLRKPPISSFRATNLTKFSELKEAFKSAIQSIENEPFDYLLCGNIHSNEFDATKFFYPSIKDLVRYTTSNVTINGVKIHKETLTQIMEAIVPDKNVNSVIVNTSPLNQGESYPLIENSLKSHYNDTDAAKISSVLQKPQFPLALLALVTQTIPMLPAAAMLNDVKFQSNVGSFNELMRDDRIMEKFGDFKAEERKYDIKMDDDGNLHCGVTSFYPYLESTGQVGASKAYSYFPVPQDFVGDRSLNDQISIAHKLDKLIPQIITAVVL